MEILWKEIEGRGDAETLLVNELQIAPLTARLLVNRKIDTPDLARRFLFPDLSQLHDPFLLPDMDKAARRIVEAIGNREKIIVHGDYDVDGVTSTAIYIRTLGKLGADVICRIPNRHVDGYDLKPKSIEWAKQQGASLIITTDCGTQAREAVTFANSLGMTVIITDHHEQGDILPDAYAVVNPHRRDSRYPWPNLAGVGVALKTMQAVVRLIKPEFEQSFLKSYLDLAACGTVADVMPLLDENRVFAAYGLDALRKTKKVGLKTLLESTGADITQRLSSETVAFGVAPRINAIGRLDDAAIALDLLLTSDEDEAKRIVARLNEANLERQHTQRRITAEAVMQVIQKNLRANPVLVVSAKHWNTGVVGIVAGKLVEQFNRPSIVIGISDDGLRCKGSARSIPAFDMFQGVSACQDLLDTCGGHEFAAGLSLQTENLEAFMEKIYSYASVRLTEDDFKPQILVDAFVDPSKIDIALLEEWERLEPFGESNPHPCLASSRMSSAGGRRIGKDQSHLKLTIEQGDGENKWRSDAVAWGRAEEWEPLSLPGSIIDIAFNPSINNYNGRRSVQLILKDMKPSVNI
jgi:single-stranded-DNA-specific exonuclease